MKFLVFNVMVAVALYSIVRGGPTSEGVREAVEQIATVAAPVISAGAGMVEEAAQDFAIRGDAVAVVEPAVAAEPLPPALAPSLAPLGPPVVVAVVPVVPPITPAEVTPTADQGPAIAAIVDPEVLARRAQVLGGQAAGVEAPDQVATTQAEPPKFMTPAERQRELFRLAREMELVFATRAGQ